MLAIVYRQWLNIGVALEKYSKKCNKNKTGKKLKKS
jgi:hypothetical protein